MSIGWPMNDGTSHVGCVGLEELRAPKRAPGFRGVPDGPARATRHRADRREAVGELVHEHRGSWVPYDREDDRPGRRRDV
eukprot:14211747-Heterocapsa_arctica.AAC.1